MVKRWFLVGVMLLVVSLLVVGCGIPQEEHDAVIAERDAAQAEVASLQSELAGVQSDLAATETDLATSESDLATAQSRISSLQSDLTAAQSLWDSLEPKLTLGATILNYWNGAAQVLAGEKTELEYEVQTTKFIGTTTVQTEAIGNAELTQLWDDVVSYGEQERMAEFFSSFAALTDLLMDLIDQDIVAIESELSK